MIQCHLPEPSAAALAHSQKMREYLNQKMRLLGGQISFDQYMHEVLYAPGLGYYSAGCHKIGAAGDFITAPEISPLFGRTLACAIAPYFKEHRHACLLELGPGSGKLAHDLGLKLAALDAFPSHYYLLEISADLKKRQQDFLRQALPPELFERCVWLETLPRHFDGIIVANEVLDALAVHLFRIEADGPLEAMVQIMPDDSWRQIFAVAQRVEVADRLEYLQQRYDLTCGYQSEMNLLQEGLLRSLSAILQQGMMIFIDYGFNGATYYHPQRSQGTLRCHYRHHVHDDPFWLPGLQDITNHVDFTALATCGLGVGLSLALYCHQDEFLLAHGILDLAKQVASDKELLQQSHALQQLLAPHEMGELFKVMVFYKKCANLFATLADNDKRHTL